MGNISNCTVDIRHGKDFYKIGQLIFLFFLFCVIIVGNLIMLRAVTLSRAEKRSRMNFFIMHLAIADLSNGLFSVFPDIVWKITVAWNAGAVMCKLVPFVRALVTISSTFILVSLSIDRLDAIARPMNFSQSYRLGRFLVISAWVLSFIFSIPLLVIQKHIQLCDNSYQCWINLPDWQWKVYFTTVTAIIFIIPAFIIVLCYVIIIYIIWQNGKKKWCVKPAVKRTWYNRRKGMKHTNGPGSEDSYRHVSILGKKGLIPHAKIRTIKMTFLIVLAFILCWSPYIVHDLLQVYGLMQGSPALATFMQSLAPLNSAANPIIYGIFSTRICRNLRKMRQINRSIQTCQQCLGGDKRRVPQRTSTLTTDCSLGSRLTEQNVDHLPEEPIAVTPFKQSEIVEHALSEFGPIQQPEDNVPTGTREGWVNSKW